MGEPKTYYSAIDIENYDEVSFKPIKSCIFKTPKILSRHNEKAYLPVAFSIGPLHHGQPHLIVAEKIKSQYFDCLLSRNPTPHTNLNDLTQAIAELEGAARDCYDVPIDYSPQDFVNMMLLDGCFIIELLRRDVEVKQDPNDPVFSMACMLQFLNHDLILLENQIPWLVLDRLFELTTKSTTNISLTNLAIGFFSQNFTMKSLPVIQHDHGSKHILDLLRNTLVLSSKNKKGELHGKWQLIPSATNLKEAGVKFKKGNSSNITDISFENNIGVLEIPPLLIQETTNVAFRNLISFEQCYPNCTAKITSYAILLDNLINTTKDISILQEAGIIDNWLNPQDTIEFFNKLYHDTYVKEFYYQDLCNNVNDYCKRCWPRARAAYVHNHFADPWAIVSQVVAGIILLLTLMQTIFAIKEKP